MATVIRVEGHAYRKEGAFMLFAEGGETIGTISPGCLEADLKGRIDEVLATNRVERIVYNMQSPDDMLWGESIGCGGAVEVLLEPVVGALAQRMAEAAERLEEGKEVCFSRYFDGPDVQYRLKIVPGDSQSKMVWKDTEEEEVFTVSMSPQPRLILFGGGYDAVPVVALARHIGFRTTVADWRFSVIDENRFPCDDVEVAIGNAEELVNSLQIGAADYVLICSHQFQKDREFLRKVLRRNPCYVGILGSTARVERMLEGCERTEAIHAPVGLDIGANGPEEIAVSIAAELIQLKNQLRG